MMEDRLKTIVGGVLRNFQEETNTASARVVLHHQLGVAMDSVVLADYSVRVNQDSGDIIRGIIFYKLDHEDNRFQEIHFSINRETFNIE